MFREMVRIKQQLTNEEAIELLQKGDALAPAEPWSNMENTGTW